MSKNITVIPLRYEQSRTFYKSHGMSFDWHDYDRYEKIDELAMPLTGDYFVYDHDIEEGDKDTKEDCYGNIVKMLLAQQFISIYDATNFTDWDKACMAFLKELPPNTLCAIYYH